MWPATRAVMGAMLCAAATPLSLASLASLAACAESAAPTVVTAPVGPVAPPSEAGAPSIVDAVNAPAGGEADAPDAPPSDDDAGVPARFRACAADADCVVVPRVGCCHNGWNEAVAASQKDAYAASFTCPEAHPICAMFIVHDTRKARCVAATRLCTLVTN